MMPIQGAPGGPGSSGTGPMYAMLPWRELEIRTRREGWRAVVRNGGAGLEKEGGEKGVGFGWVGGRRWVERREGGGS